MNDILQLDEWVLCRVRQKSGNPRNTWDSEGNSPPQPTGFHLSKQNEVWSSNTNAVDIEMAKNFVYNDCPMLPYMFASQDYSSTINFQQKDNFIFSINSLKRRDDNDVRVPPSKKIAAEEIAISVSNEYEGSDPWRIMQHQELDSLAFLEN